MTSFIARVLKSAAVAAPLFASGTAFADGGATGVWIDHTGRGAVEITNCGSNLCGRVVWIKDEKNAKGCGVQIIGNAKPVAGGKWDNGWIYDPDNGGKYSVEITPLGGSKLKVLGYSGSKMLSETMIWKRASGEIKRCQSA